MNVQREQTLSLVDLVRMVRPSQWTKNAVVFAAFFFALWDRAQHVQFLAGLARIVPAAVIFCLVSSGVYIVNDIIDADADRNHPHKKFRPIAAGRVPPGVAGRLLGSPPGNRQRLTVAYRRTDEVRR